MLRQYQVLFSLGLHYLWLRRRYFRFSLTYSYFDFVEGRLHLGKTNKNKVLFGFSLGLHYLCERLWQQIVHSNIV